MRVTTPPNRLQPLPSEILRRESQAIAESTAGIQWTNTCPVGVSRRIAAVVSQTTNTGDRVYWAADDHRKVGSSSGDAAIKTRDVLNDPRASDEDRLDAVAATVYAFVDGAANDKEDVEDWHNFIPPTYDAETFLAAVNDILLANRIDWHFSEGRFVQRGSSSLHADVVKPATVLLDSDPKFAAASQGFGLAITRLSEGKPDVAITDAATAVQEFFRALGVKGNSISDQVDAAVKAKLLTQEDRNLLKPLTDWMNADRSNRGNAHAVRADDAIKADAWLAIHVAGAVMVRLSNQEPRDILAAREKREADLAQKLADEEAAKVQPASPATDDIWNVPDVWNTPGNYNDQTPF